jgi:hypothetical protein
MRWLEDQTVEVTNLEGRKNRIKLSNLLGIETIVSIYVKKGLIPLPRRVLDGKLIGWLFYYDSNPGFTVHTQLATPEKNTHAVVITPLDGKHGDIIDLLLMLVYK